MFPFRDASHHHAADYTFSCPGALYYIYKDIGINIQQFITARMSLWKSETQPGILFSFCSLLILSLSHLHFFSLCFFVFRSSVLWNLYVIWGQCNVLYPYRVKLN